MPGCLLFHFLCWQPPIERFFFLSMACNLFSTFFFHHKKIFIFSVLIQRVQVVLIAETFATKSFSFFTTSLFVLPSYFFFEISCFHYYMVDPLHIDHTSFHIKFIFNEIGKKPQWTKRTTNKKKNMKPNKYEFINWAMSIHGWTNVAATTSRGQENKTKKPKTNDHKEMRRKD